MASSDTTNGCIIVASNALIHRTAMRNISLKSIENQPQITVSYEGYGRLYCGKEQVELIGFFKGNFRLLKSHSQELITNKTCEIGDLEAISSSRVMFRPKNGRKFEPIYCHPYTLKRYDKSEMVLNRRLHIQDAKGNQIKMTIHADERLTTHGKNTITLSENFKPQHEYISDELKTLNEAAKLWANADPDDKDTHPTNKQVSDWLKARGFSAISAEQGAVIIRPDWATKGRRK